MSENTRICPCAISTIYVFESPAFQNGADTVYLQKKAYDAAQVAIGSQKKYQFKTDFERMQYLVGLYGRTSRGLQ
jgi:hypothetical protein